MKDQLQDLGQHLNDATIENLFQCLSRIYTENNLLVLSKELSKIVNYLTAFSKLKTAGKFENTVWLEELPPADVFSSITQTYNSLIVIVPGTDAGIEGLQELWQLVGKSSIKTNIIVKDLDHSFYYRFIGDVLRKDTTELLAKSIKTDLSAPILRMSAQCRLMSWKTHPLCIQDFVLSLNSQNGGLEDYLNNPILPVSQLADAVVDIIGETVGRRDMIKLKNVFAKGDHASLLTNLILNEKIPDLLSSRFATNEQDFYLGTLSGNTDLVVVERNLDYFPLLLSHMNYMGLLDDLCGTQDEINNVLDTKEKLDDELYDSIKHLNFGSIGVKLNKLAKYIQSEYESSDKLTDIKEIKQLVKNLGNLTTKQDLVSKHTSLSANVLDKIKSNTDGPYKFDLQEIWLGVQNELFDLDYKSQLGKLNFLIDQDSCLEIVISCIALVSLINDGLRQRDLDDIQQKVVAHFGVEAGLMLRKLYEIKIVRVNTRANDFFGSFTFGKTEIETTTTTTSTAGLAMASDRGDDQGYEDLASVGVTGGQDIYKSTYTLINKFWNLHPLEEEGEADVVIETVNDYPHPSFALPSATVPLLTRIVESLYFRDFLKYKPVNNVFKRPNWHNLNLDTMFKGQTIDRNICDESDNRKASSVDTRPQYLLLVVIGGITRSEISTLAHLQGKLKKKILVVTTGLVNNKKLLKALTVV